MALIKINKNAQGVPTGEYTDIAGGTLYADVGIGAILPFGGTSDKIPQGYLLCDGTSLLRASYPELFAVIGTAFGSADSTHFNIPDLRGEFLRGAGTNNHSGQGDGGNVGDHQDGTSQIALVSYNREVYFVPDVASSLTNADKVRTGGQYQYLANNSGKTGTGEYFANFTARPTNTSVNYIIKAKMVALPADLASGVEEYIDEKFEVEDLSSQISSTVASGILCYKCGKTVTLVLSNVLVSSNGQITGVPKNASIASGALIASDASASAYLSTGSIGNNYININIGASNKRYYGSITYFTND